jgi:tripartite motif-containing protein 71
MIPLLERGSLLLLLVLVFELIAADHNILHGFTQEKTEKKEKIYFVLEWGSRGSDKGEFKNPHSIAIDPFGNLFVTDTANDRLQKFTSNGTFLMQWGTFGNKTGEFLLPLGIDIDSSNNIYIVDQAKSQIQKFTSNGTFLMQFGNKTVFKQLEDIEIDSFDNLYLTDKGDSSIKKYTIA